MCDTLDNNVCFPRFVVTEGVGQISWSVVVM